MTTPATGIDDQAAVPAALTPVPGMPAAAPAAAVAGGPAAEPTSAISPIALSAAAAASPAEFYDSTRPWLFPAGTTHAALYFDGLYGDAGRAAAGDFPEIRWITVIGDAKHAGIADYEPGNGVYDEPGILFDWAEWRIEHGHRARVYVQRSLARRALAELGQLVNDPRLVFWIPTLDNRAWTRDELAADLAQNYAAPIAASQLWANQNVQDGRRRWDRSQLWGTW